MDIESERKGKEKRGGGDSEGKETRGGGQRRERDKRWETLKG